MTGTDHDLGGALRDLAAVAAELSIASEKLAKAARILAVTPPEPVAGSTLVTRQVWVATIPEGDEYGVGPVEVMIEQFGQGDPTIALRRTASDVWGRPYAGVRR